MGDQQEKLKQPEFKVREESTVTLSVEPEPGSEASTEQKSLPAPVSAQPPKEQASKSESPEQDAKEWPPADDLPERPKFKLNSRPVSGGLLRHRLLVGGCLLFSMSFMALSVLDFSPLVKTTGQVNTSMQFVPDKDTAELPLNTEYVDTQWVNGKYEPQDDAFRRIREDRWNSESKYGFANRQGKIIIPPTFNEVYQFQDGRAAFRNEAGRWGFIDESGKVVIKPVYLQVMDSFHNGVAVVQETDGNVAMIDNIGNVITRTGRASLTRIANLYQGFGDNSSIVLWYNHKGQTVDLSEYDHVERLAVEPLTESSWSNALPRRPKNSPLLGEEFIRTTKKGKFGLLDGEGRLIVKPIFDNIGPMSNGVAPFKKGDILGFFNRNGKIVCQTDLESLTSYDDLMAGTDSGGQWHVIDKSGKRINLKIDGVIDRPDGKWLCDGLGAVIQGDKVGFVNSKGQMVIPPKFNFALPFGDGFAPVWDGEYWHFIDKSGNIANLPSFSKISPFFNGVADVTVPGPLYNIVNASWLKYMKENMDSVRENFTRRESPFSGQRRYYGY
jgi:hypothetical protein